MQESTKISAKGQVVLPAAIRRALGLEVGQTLRVTPTSNGVLLTPVTEKSGKTTDELLEELRSIYAHRGPPATIEDMERAVDRMFSKSGVEER